MLIAYVVRHCRLGLLTVLAAAVSPTLAPAAVVTLSDTGFNSSMVYNTASGNLTSWKVEGIENLNQRLYFVRVGAPAPGNAEVAVNDSNFTLTSFFPYDVDLTPGTEGVTVVYTDTLGQYKITENTTLVPEAPGSFQATYTDSIRIDNLTNSTLTISLFLYADYNLANTLVNDAVAVIGTRSLNQVLGDTIFETGVTITPTRFQAGTPAILASLTNGSSTTLNNTPVAGSTDLAYAFQWDFAIPAGKSVSLGSSNTLTLAVPEASSIAMLGAAAVSFGGLLVSRRRRNA